MKKSDVNPTCVPSIYSHTELGMADQVSSNWSALPVLESTDSDSSDERCLRPTRTQAVKGSKDKPLETVITHKSASPKQLDEWSKTFKYSRDVVIRVVQVPSETNNIICSAKEKPGVCPYCGISGHWQRECWKIKRDFMRRVRLRENGNRTKAPMTQHLWRHLRSSLRLSSRDAVEVN